MKNTKKIMLVTIGFAILVLFLTGCSSQRVSLSDEGLVTVEKKGTDKFKFLWTNIYKQDDKTWAYGVIRQRSRKNSMPSIITQVDVKVLFPDGTKYFETRTKDIYVPSKRMGRGLGWATVKVQLPDALPENSRIEMMVRPSSCDSGNNS